MVLIISVYEIFLFHIIACYFICDYFRCAKNKSLHNITIIIMATVKAFIRTGKKGKPVNVRFRLSDGRDIQLFHVSEIYIQPEKWDAKNEKHISPRIATKLERSEEKQFNDSIIERKGLVLSTYLNNEIKDSETLNDLIDKALNPNRGVTNLHDLNIEQRFEMYYEDAHKNGVIGSVTKKSYAVFARELRRFLIINRLVGIKTSEFSNNHILELMQFLKMEYTFVEHYIDLYKDVRNVPTEQRVKNTIATKLKRFQAFFNEIENRDEIQINPFRKLGRKQRSQILREQYDEPVFLLKSEFMQIKEAVVPKSLQSAKDTFLLHCALGCRIGDYQRLSYDNISVEDGIPYMHYMPEKTKKDGAIRSEIKTPLLKFALDIIKKTNFDLPLLKYASGKDGYNKKIRKLIKFIGIERKVACYNEQKGINEYKSLSDIASSKLARKTHVDIMNKVQVNLYAAGLHKEGSRAVERYTSMGIEDRFILMCAAFGEDDYRVDDKLNVK